MKASAAEIVLVVLITLFVAAQKTIAISRAVRSRTAEDSQKPAGAMPVKVRAFRIVTLAAARIIRARVQTVLVTLVVRVRAITIVAIVRRLV
jgi:hypothetical protein